MTAYMVSTRNPTLNIKSISPEQCRAARALLSMEQNALAAASSVSRGVIIDFEKGRRTPGKNNLAAIRAALEAAGVEFINGTGVKLK
jgi:transcriptional regulator with XRE-family HTH domain